MACGRGYGGLHQVGFIRSPRADRRSGVGVCGLNLRAVVGSGVVFHLGALRSGARKVEAMDMAIEVSVWVRVGVVFVGCWAALELHE